MRNFIRRTAAALAVLCMAALLLGTPTEAEERTYSAGGEAVGYYAGWAAYQGFTPDQIPAEHLTQINYALPRSTQIPSPLLWRIPPMTKRTWPPCGSCASRTSISSC